MMDNPITFVKDPNARLDYSVNWTRWLDGDSLQTVSWFITPPTGLASVSTSNTTGIATIWLASGTAGQVFQVRNHIITAGGREDDRTFTIIVRNK